MALRILSNIRNTKPYRYIRNYIIATGAIGAGLGIYTCYEEYKSPMRFITKQSYYGKYKYIDTPKKAVLNGIGDMIAGFIMGPVIVPLFTPYWIKDFLNISYTHKFNLSTADKYYNVVFTNEMNKINESLGPDEIEYDFSDNGVVIHRSHIILPPIFIKKKDGKYTWSCQTGNITETLTFTDDEPDKVDYEYLKTKTSSPIVIDKKKSKNGIDTTYQ